MCLYVWERGVRGVTISHKSPIPHIDILPLSFRLPSHIEHMRCQEEKLWLRSGLRAGRVQENDVLSKSSSQCWEDSSKQMSLRSKKIRLFKMKLEIT